MRGSRRDFYFEPERGLREWTRLRESGKEVNTRNTSYQAGSGNNQSFSVKFGKLADTSYGRSPNDCTGFVCILHVE